MGPKNHVELFSKTAHSSLDGIHEEFLRRNVVSPVLGELSDGFNEYPHNPGPLTEPTLVARLYALARVQMSPMGVAGFDPHRAVGFERQMVRVQATPAPHHDEYRRPTGETVQTRVCRLEMPDEDYGAVIEVFGLNLFIPDVNSDTTPPDSSTKPPSELLVVGKANRVSGKSQPVAGETVAFAVRNKVTGDAKLYRVTLQSPGQTLPLGREEDVTYVDTIARVALPGGLSAEVEVLSGALQQQMVDELSASLAELRRADKAALTSAERAAIAEL